MSSIVQPKVAAAEPEHGANLQVLRAVATFELAKGLIVLAGGMRGSFAGCIAKIPGILPTGCLGCFTSALTTTLRKSSSIGPTT